jgi:hypothetical protein
MYGAIYAGGAPENDNLRPEEMWNIDTKLDDGKPGTGKMVDRAWGTNQCNNATSSVDYAATYNVSTTTVSCHPVFRQMF